MLRRWVNISKVKRDSAPCLLMWIVSRLSSIPEVIGIAWSPELSEGQKMPYGIYSGSLSRQAAADVRHAYMQIWRRLPVLTYFILHAGPPAVTFPLSDHHRQYTKLYCLPTEVNVWKACLVVEWTTVSRTQDLLIVNTQWTIKTWHFIFDYNFG